LNAPGKIAEYAAQIPNQLRLLGVNHCDKLLVMRAAAASPQWW
jgi:hypothetical protein